MTNLYDFDILAYINCKNVVSNLKLEVKNTDVATCFVYHNCQAFPHYNSFCTFDKY